MNIKAMQSEHVHFIWSYETVVAFCYEVFFLKNERRVVYCPNIFTHLLTSKFCPFSNMKTLPLCVIFRNMLLYFYGGQLLTHLPNFRLEEYNLSVSTTDR